MAGTAAATAVATNQAEPHTAGIIEGVGTIQIGPPLLRCPCAPLAGKGSLLGERPYEG